MNSTLTPSATGELTSANLLTVCGVGRAGARILQQLAPTLPGCGLWALDSEVQATPPDPLISRLEIGARMTRGMGCGGDALYAQRAAEAELARIQERVRPGLFVLLAGIGGGVGAGMSPVLARLARQAGALVVAVVIEPFDFEGGLRHRNAEQCLVALQGTCDAVIRVPNQAVAGLSPETTAVQELMALADQHVVQVVEGLLRLLRGPSLIPVGLAELERWARGRQAEGVAAFAAAQGPERVQTLWTALEQHPFLQPASRLEEAGGVLLYVVGGPDLRLDELELLQQELRRCSPRAQILVGAGLDSSVGGRLIAFLLAVRDGVGLPPTTSERGMELAQQRPTPVKSLMFEDANRSGDSRGTGLDLSSMVRDTGRQRVSLAGSRKAQQQQFNFVPPWTGRFDSAEGTLHEGENLDEPTFVRRGVKLN